MSYCNKLKQYINIFLLAGLLSSGSHADVASAALAMENPDNPLIHVATSRGAIFVELLPREAPNNVANFLGLVSGEVEIIDQESGSSATAPYYDNTRLHRVIPNFVIQAGSPSHHPLGAPAVLIADEINADALGLGRRPVLNSDASVNPLLNIHDHDAFATQVLSPLYDNMNINSLSELERRQQEVLQRLESLTLKSLYEMQGYRYQDDFPTRPILRGTMALANSGPNSNGPEFFIALTDLPSLNGKYTVIGTVVEGMNVVDQIGTVAVDPETASSQSTVINSIQEVSR